MTVSLPHRTGAQGGTSAVGYPKILECTGIVTDRVVGASELPAGEMGFDLLLGSRGMSLTITHAVSTASILRTSPTLWSHGRKPLGALSVV